MAGALDLPGGDEALGLFQLGEKPAVGHLTATLHDLCLEVTEKTKYRISTDVHNRRTRDSGPKLKQKDANWVLGDKNFTQRIIKKHSRLPIEVV